MPIQESEKCEWVDVVVDSTHPVHNFSSVAANEDARYENCEASIEKFLNSYHQV